MYLGKIKTKVVLEVLIEKETLKIIAKKYGLLPSQISAWKAEAIKNISTVFTQGNGGFDKGRNSCRETLCQN